MAAPLVSWTVPAICDVAADCAKSPAQNRGKQHSALNIFIKINLSKLKCQTNGVCEVYQVTTIIVKMMPGKNHTNRWAASHGTRLSRWLLS
jgi:hypothetical protein